MVHCCLWGNSSLQCLFRVSVLLLFVFLSGCTPESVTEIEVSDGGEVGQVAEVVIDSGLSVTGEKKGSVESTTITQSAVENKTLCVAEWICLSAKAKIYREGNCSFTLRQECKFGCKNNTCVPAPVCTSGWNCDGNYYRGYRLESCEFEKKEKCEFGCKDAVCLNESAAETKVEGTVSSEPVATVESTPSASTLLLGETVVIENRNVSIYTLTDEVVMLSVDGRKSGLIKQGGNYTREGLVIFIEEILFQPYNNGKKMITYRVG